MQVHLSTSILGNLHNLVTVGAAGELMAWFYPHKDHAQHINACLPCVYLGHGGQGRLVYSYDEGFVRSQSYLGDSNVLETIIEGFGLRITYTDAMPDDLPVLARRIRVENISSEWKNGGFYLLGHYKMGGFREGNALVYSRGSGILTQNHREAALAMGGDALQGWQCGKAGPEWANNATYALDQGILQCQDLEIGDVNLAVGFYAELLPGESVEKTLYLALGPTLDAAIQHLAQARERGFEAIVEARTTSDAQSLANGIEALSDTNAEMPADLEKAYKRSLLALPLLCGEEGAAVAAPEFDPEFISCGGYGYLWPRDGGEYVSGLMDAGYPEFATKFFDWSARHQDASGLWHQRYFLNGAPGPNWCLPPDMLQIDQVGAVLWAYGKWLDHSEKSKNDTGESTNAWSLWHDQETAAIKPSISPEQMKAIESTAVQKLRESSQGKLSEGARELIQHEMVRRAADYLLERQDEATGVHKNAFDTWETFVGSFTYSNAAIYAAFVTAARVLGDEKYTTAAQKMKAGVLTHFVRETNGYKYLVRGLKADGSPDDNVDSASLGAIEPFGLLDLDVPEELELAIGTLRAVTEKLEVDWMGGRAIRRFEGDAYVGGVPACVNTLWMARCCLLVAEKTHDTALVERAKGFLQVVLKRATPTLLLPELMQGPEGQTYWAAPHGWAMSSFVSGVLKWAKLSRLGLDL